MSGGGCAGVRISLGAYVLGALGPGERAHTEDHLAVCPACRDELVQLAGLPGLLGRLSLADVTGTSESSETSGDSAAADAAGGAQVGGSQAGDVVREGGAGVGGRLDRPERPERPVERALAELGRWRRTARRRLAAAAVALALAAAGVSAAATIAATPGEGPPGRVLSATDPGTQVEATVWVADGPTGTGFTVRLRNVPPGTHCVLVAQAADGSRETAASWVANYYGEVDVRGASGIAAGQLAMLLVVSESGEQLVAVPARPA